MALNNPSNLYTGYAQVFNEAPHIAFRARLLAQYQAKQDALDSYYRKLPLMINEKGVRDQERPDINKSMLGIKSYYIQNKDNIRKGDGAAAFNYEKMIRDHQDLVAQSQAAGLVDTQVGKLKFNPNVQYMFQSPETVDQLAKHHLPVTDPNHVDFDLETFSAPPKPLDINTYMKPFDSMKYDDAAPEVTKNNDGTETVTTRHIPSAEAKSTIMARANFDYLHNPSFTKAVDDLGAPDATNPLNPVFKELYGRDIKDPMDLGAAMIAANKIQQPTTVKRQIDRNAEWDRRNKITFEQHKKLIDRNKAAGVPPPNTGYLSDEVDEAVGEDVQTPKWTEPRRVVYTDKVDPDRLNTIIGRDYSKKQLGVDPKVLQMEDGKYRDYYEVDPTTGDWIGKGEQRISREAAKDRYVNKMSPTAFKSKIGTKAQEGKKAAPTTTTDKTHKTSKGIVIPVFTK